MSLIQYYSHVMRGVFMYSLGVAQEVPFIIYTQKTRKAANQP